MGQLNPNEIRLLAGDVLILDTLFTWLCHWILPLILFWRNPHLHLFNILNLIFPKSVLKKMSDSQYRWIVLICQFLGSFLPLATKYIQAFVFSRRWWWRSRFYLDACLVSCTNSGFCFKSHFSNPVRRTGFTASHYIIKECHLSVSISIYTISS